MGCYEYDGDAVDDDVETPMLQTTIRNYPNPIYLESPGSGGNPYTIFEFSTPTKLRRAARVDIYNIKGQRVKTLETNTNMADMVAKIGLSGKDTSQFKSNSYSIIWDAKGDNFKALPTGVYLQTFSRWSL